MVGRAVPGEPFSGMRQGPKKQAPWGPPVLPRFVRSRRLAWAAPWRGGKVALGKPSAGDIGDRGDTGDGCEPGPEGQTSGKRRTPPKDHQAKCEITENRAIFAAIDRVSLREPPPSPRSQASPRSPSLTKARRPSLARQRWESRQGVTFGPHGPDEAGPSRQSPNHPTTQLPNYQTTQLPRLPRVARAWARIEA